MIKIASLSSKLIQYAAECAVCRLRETHREIEGSRSHTRSASSITKCDIGQTEQNWRENRTEGNRHLRERRVDDEGADDDVSNENAVRPRPPAPPHSLTPLVASVCFCSLHLHHLLLVCPTRAVENHVAAAIRHITSGSAFFCSSIR